MSYRYTGFVLLCLLVFFFNCKDMILEKFQLIVTLNEGVSGYPSAGDKTYNEGTTISYSYSLEQNYKDLQVLLDDVLVANSGTITMDKNHLLKVNAQKKLNITGRWNIEINWTCADNPQYTGGLLDEPSIYDCQITHENNNLTMTGGEGKYYFSINGIIQENGSFLMEGNVPVKADQSLGEGYTAVLRLAGTADESNLTGQQGCTAATINTCSARITLSKDGVKKLKVAGTFTGKKIN